MNKEMRDELRGMCDRITPGEWLDDDTYIYNQLPGYYDAKLTIAYASSPEYARLIAATHNALPGLLDELDEKDAEIERLSVALRLAQVRVEGGGASNDQ